MLMLRAPSIASKPKDSQMYFLAQLVARSLRLSEKQIRNERRLKKKFLKLKALTVFKILSRESAYANCPILVTWVTDSDAD